MLLGVAAGGAVAFVLLRVFYRMVLGGASLGDTVLWTWPRLALGGPFSHVVLFGPVTAEGLLAALWSALPFALLILASGSLIAFFDPRGLIFLVPMPEWSLRPCFVDTQPKLGRALHRDRIRS